MLLGLVEIILAVLWIHIIGVVSGVLCFMFGALAIYVTLSTLYYSSRAKRARILGFIVNVLVVLFVVLLIIIHAIGANSEGNTFPTKCKTITYCCRLMLNNSTNIKVNNLTAPIINSSYLILQQTVKDWVIMQPQAKYLYQTTDLIHIQFVSLFFGFPDDMYIQFNCLNTSQVGFNIQSESRIDVRGFNDNYNRVLNFVNFLTQTSIQPGFCNNNYTKYINNY